MISSVTFETAALADAVKKAARLAPTKGEAFDKAAGIVLAFDPTQSVPLALLKSTDLHIFSMEWVTVTEWAGEPAQWRLPSVLAALVIGSLPIGTGKTVTFESEATEFSYTIKMTQGRTRAKFYPLDISYYPEWGAFDPDDMHPAKDLGGRIAQVEWAAGKSDPRYAGVLLDGQYALATDSYRMARVPLLIPNLVEPMVVPAGILGSALSQTGETKVGVSDNMLQIMPDEYSQLKSVIFDVKFPNVSKIVDREFDTQIQIDRDRLIEAMRRVDAVSMGERGVAMRCFLGAEEFAVFMQNDQIGQVGDVVEIPGNATHDRFEIKFTPKNILDGLMNSPNNQVTLHYDAGNPISILKIDGGSGYEAWIVPRRSETVG